jgi:hypothetical protein
MQQGPQQCGPFAFMAFLFSTKPIQPIPNRVSGLSQCPIEQKLAVLFRADLAG